MGKSRRGRNQRGRPSSRGNPTGLASVKTTKEDLGATSSLSEQVYEQTEAGKIVTEESVQSIIEQLQSTSSEERDCACNALATLLRTAEDVKVALSHGVVRVLCPLLVDSSAAVRHSAAGALHNLTLLGGEQCCLKALSDDVMTPLIALFRKFPSNWTPNKQAVGEKIDSQTQTFIEAVHVLCNLCESSSKAVDIFHRENLMPVISRCLSVEVFGIDVVVVALQCLYTVTEDQGDVAWSGSLAEEIKKNVTNNEQLDTYAATFIRTLGLGVLLNLDHGKLSNIPHAAAVSTLAAALRLDHRKTASDLIDSLPIARRSADDVTDDMDSDGPSVINADRPLKEMQRLISAQTLALEILANLCCDQDPEDQYEDIATDDESVSDGSMDVDGVAVDEGLVLDPQIHEAVVSLNLFQLVLAKANLPAENVCEALASSDEGRVVLDQLNSLRCHAFLCLSNLANSLTVDEMGGPELLISTWSNLGKLAFQESSNTELLEAATTTMRSVIRRLAESSSGDMIRSQLQLTDLAAICEAAKGCLDPRCKVNLIQILGILGSLAAGTVLPLSETSQACVKMIGELLVEFVCADFELWIIAEALDAVFDVFKEDHVDFIAQDVQLVERLKAAVPTLKTKIHAQRRRLGDHYPIVMTAKDNLIRFIKYKATQRR